MGVLRDRMEHDIVVRGLSANTQRGYLFVVTDLARYHRRSPGELSDRDVQRYVRYLIEERRLAWGSLRMMVSGLRFFYWTTLGREPSKFVMDGTVSGAAARYKRNSARISPTVRGGSRRCATA